MTEQQKIDEKNPLDYVRRTKKRGWWNWKIKAVIYAMLAVVLVAVGGVTTYKIFVPKEASITNDVVHRQLEEVQDLTTMVERDYGFVTYKDGNTVFTTKQFTMFYIYEARAGFDLSKAKIEVKDKTVDVTLPAPTVQSISIDSDKLRFFDKSSTPLNQMDAEDTKKALDVAKKQCEKDLDRSELLKSANEHGKEVVRKLLFGALSETDGYTVNVTTIEPKS
ncbi:DUF4230 domain-containing protein [Bifidobacterium sp. CP2]|uniref:DUF4230 domain-containing protein n=1 Tax=Bifidobacterium sp. CP2 TaxID=2809025 RepID=UPI001BDD1FB3|nr:DUF4230 domain-containing protein [Bifidobacterium sp. CP2]MBT1181009.1 DUF4230 domain-containing protein [Bifidobacterium sp. CP2]